MHILGTPLLALRSRLNTMRRSIIGIFPLGIAARMTIALGSVAILAIAANIVGQTTVLFVRTHSQDARDAPVNRIAPHAPRLDPASAVNIRWKDLALAIDRFQHASEMRAERESGLNDSEYLDARGALLKFDDAQFNAMASTHTGAAKFAHDIKLFVEHGQILVTLSDERREARAGYLRTLDLLDIAMQRATDGSWTILGRVVARQSLLQLRAELDAIRRGSEVLRSEELPSTSGVDGLIAREAAFLTTLTAYQAGLVKSEGTGWVQEIQGHLSTLTSLREQQVVLGAQQDESERSLAKERSALSAAASAAYATGNLVTARNTATPAAAPATNTGHADPPIASDAPLADSIVTTETGAGRDARATMAIVTMLTLLVTAVVCILTVRSVIVPVRRFLDATTKLARGDDRVRVRSGGSIRELDTLASAFNEMAQQLADERVRTRHQNETLEAKVVEKTRQLQRLAEEDPLTSLPNRRRLQTLLSIALDNATCSKGWVGVYFVDIDNFKSFNDSLGHAFGDRVLMSVANRLEELVEGRGFVARLGGDEFTVVYGDAPSAEAIRELGLSIVTAFHPLLLVDDREFSVSVSVGASIFPEHGTAAEGLLRAADSALFSAKASGRSQLVVFTAELIETAAVRFATEQGLRRAIDRREFLLMYQPEVSLTTFEIGLVEALLRWQRPDGRLAHPGEFLPVAEQSSLASEINEWVLRAAVSDAAQWHHGGWPNVRVAINVSPRQLLDRRFTERLLLLLEEHRLPTRCIELELTETVLQTGPLTIDTLRALRLHGIGIALDDFGTGYSSITSLQDLPLSRVKLDRSLIATIDTSERASVITRAIIELCDGLGLEVTAEGIERPEQLAWLSNQSPMFLQGYLLSHARPFADVLGLRAIMPQKMQDLLLSQSSNSSPVPSAVGLLRGRAGTSR